MQTSEVAWWRRVDPLIPSVAVVALIAFLVRGIDAFVNRDQGLYFYAGQQVADGHLPYVQVFNRSGPIAHIAPAIPVGIARLIGADQITTVRIFYVLIGVAAVTLAYLLGRELFGRWPGLVAAAAMLGTDFFVRTSTRGLSDKLVVTLLAEIALLLLLRGWWLAAGLTIGLAGITWQPIMLAAPVAAAAIALLAGKPPTRVRVRRLLLLAAGGATPLLLCLAAYAAVGRLQLFLDCFLLVNSTSASPSTVGAQGPDALELAEQGFGSTLAMLVAALGLVLIMVIALRSALSATERHSPEGATLIGIGLYAVLGAIWTSIDFDSSMDLLMLVPVAALGLAGLTEMLAQALPTRVGRVVCGAVIAVCLTAFVLRLPAGDFARVDEQRRASVAVMSVVPADAAVLSVEAPQALALSGRTNLTRFQLYGRFVKDYLDRRRPGGFADYRRWVRRTHPAVVVTNGSASPPWVQAMLAEGGYQQVGRGPMLRFWVADEYADAARKALASD